MRTASKFERRLKWFGLFLLFLKAASVWSSPVEVPFQLRAGLIWVRVDGPNGGKPMNFILDSGAEASVVNLQTARHLRLVPGQPVTVCGINANAVGYWPEYLPARMGGVALPTNYLAMDLTSLSEACHRHVDGLIGRRFFCRARRAD